MKKILVVDDSKVYRTAISQLFKKFRFTVYEAADGLEGQEIILENKIDLAIIDIVMPKLDGFALCRWIKNTPRTSNIPVIIYSDKGEEFDIYWGKKQGANLYLKKPATARELVHGAESLLKIELVNKDFDLTKALAYQGGYKPLLSRQL